MLKQSECAATPFLISKQPHFVLLFSYVAPFSSFSVWLPLAARESPADLSPQLISRRPTFPPPLLRWSSSPISFLALFSPTLAILSPVLFARSSARTRVVPISLPATFDPPTGLRFSFHPLHSFRITIIFLANRLVHSLHQRYLQRANPHSESRVIDNESKATRCVLLREIRVELAFDKSFPPLLYPTCSNAAKSPLFMFLLSRFATVHVRFRKFICASVRNAMSTLLLHLYHRVANIITLIPRRARALGRCNLFIPL